MKPKEETKPIEDKSNNQPKPKSIFNLLMKDYNNLKFEYVSPTKDVSFYEYKDSKELFNAIKDNQN